MSWVYAPAVLAFLAGLAIGWRTMRRGRKPYRGEDSLIAWASDPLSSWQQDPAAGAFILLHSGSIFTLGILLLLMSGRVPDDPTTRILGVVQGPISIPGVAGDTEMLVLLAAGLALVAYLCGVLAAYPIASRLIRPVHTALVPDGVMHGQYYLPWNRFSHYGADSRSRLIRLYSTRCPNLAISAIQPPTDPMFSQVVTLLRDHLPDVRPSPPTDRYRCRWVLLGSVLLFAIPMVAIGVGLYILSLAWTWYYYVLAAYAMSWLGVVLPRACGAT